MKRLALLGAVLALGLAGSAGAAGVRIPAGSWTGTFAPAGGEQRSLVVELRGGSAVVSLAAGHPARTVVPARTTGDRLRLTLPGRPAIAFDGRLRGRAIVGTIRQGAVRGTFRLARRPPAGAVARQQTLGLYRLPAGDDLALVEVPGLGSFPGARFQAIGLDGGELRGLFPLAGRRYAVGAALAVREPSAGEAELAPDGSSLAWRVGAEPAVATRVPLRQLEVRFASGRNSLAGTLTLPPGPGPHPALAIVHGSGATPRSHGQNWVAFYARHGIAVLAYDKRGIGHSLGAWPGENANPVSIGQYAADAQAAVRFLAAQPEVDRGRIGLAGGSQAGWIIPLAAAREPLVRFAVVLVGPTVTTDENDFYADLTNQGDGPPDASPEEIERRLRQEARPGGFDPAPSIRALRIPVVWLYGALDQHVPTGRSIEILRAITAQTGQDFTWVVFPTAAHGLLDTGSTQNAAIAGARRMAPGLFPTIRDWLRSRRIVRGS